MVRYFGMSCSPRNRGQGIVADLSPILSIFVRLEGQAHVHSPGNLPTALLDVLSSDATPANLARALIDCLHNRRSMLTSMPYRPLVLRPIRLDMQIA
ncbi:hypothetical protein HBI56_102060 [Parastagonospora nodorum]|uniref:Uncharacterized protein n=1 Tax=Phaeosphaeria nodorum (strain SN15 / ATCC MYA-4574 / FGSC 10173) TaxID=321614 RepID=A0A7U2I4Q3_PHANO|nr:hypothetical protein HBH56_031010 [Parastagonospora nodorum]QRC99327.1 hypothetical protein JI435_436880 [Parastagonospora nodorum SN15]KAH3934628.1 hypothetical protein HBH54_051000 [Parastagonospora nodorum]KAH3943093.1 hypothetical protein HBH53_179670 [Parastagonospora nodorum]KAH3956648.1 hypothetical protein HBH51_238350 [Parastagonospora nodorum]